MTKVLQWMALQLAKHWPRRCCPCQLLLQSSIQPLQLVRPSNSAENYFHGYFLKCHLKLLKLPLIFNFNIKQISSPPKPWWIEMRKALIELTTLVKPKALLSFSIFSSSSSALLSADGQPSKSFGRSNLFNRSLPRETGPSGYFANSGFLWYLHKNLQFDPIMWNLVQNGGPSRLKLTTMTILHDCTMFNWNWCNTQWR